MRWWRWDQEERADDQTAKTVLARMVQLEHLEAQGAAVTIAGSSSDASGTCALSYLQ